MFNVKKVVGIALEIESVNKEMESLANKYDTMQTMMFEGDDSIREAELEMNLLMIRISVLQQMEFELINQIEQELRMVNN